MKLLELFLLEELQASHIVDLYLLMSMPELEDKANQYVKNEVVKSAQEETMKTFEGIVMEELGNLDYTDEFGMLYRLILTEMGDPTDLISNEDVEKHAPRAMHKFDKQLMKRQKEEKEADKKGEFFNQRIRGEEQTLLELKRKVKAKQLLSVFYVLWELDLGRVHSFKDLAGQGKRTGTTWAPSIVPWIFNQFYWDENYGGPAWAEVAEFVIKMDKVPEHNNKEFFRLFDRVIDFVHNTGTIRDKVAEDDPGLEAILDVKAHVIDPRELRKFASADVKKMFNDPAWRSYLIGLSQKGTVTGEDPERMTKGRREATKRAFGDVKVPRGGWGEEFDDEEDDYDDGRTVSGTFKSEVETIVQGAAGVYTLIRLEAFTKYTGVEQFFQVLDKYMRREVKRELDNDFIDKDPSQVSASIDSSLNSMRWTLDSHEKDRIPHLKRNRDGLVKSIKTGEVPNRKQTEIAIQELDKAIREHERQKLLFKRLEKVATNIQHELRSGGFAAQD